MSEQETQELIQDYKNRYMSYRNSISYREVEDKELWQFLANCLARDLIKAKSDIVYINSKIREMEKLNGITNTSKSA